jgi:S1-C subfamily serine protease
VSNVDWIVLAVVALAALNGLRTGLIAGAFSLAGIAGGAILGARIAPQFLHGGSASPYTPLAALAGAVLLGGVIQSAAGMVGGMLRRSLFVLPPLKLLDTLGGLLLGAATGLALVWVAGVAALQLPGQVQLRQYAQQSEVLRRLNEIAPPRRVLNALARIDPFPTIIGPAPPTEPPDAAVLRLPGVRKAYPSVVRVTGVACGLGIEGSGWVARRGLVVTAAHVVAGVRHPTVQPRGRGPELPATTVAYDRTNDVAVLRVPGLHARPLRAVTAEAGNSVAILGFPENGPFDAQPGRVGVTRRYTVVAGRIRHGNSGGPAVDASGAVETTIFAARVGSKSGFGVPTRWVAKALARAKRPVSTGACSS